MLADGHLNLRNTIHLPIHGHLEQIGNLHAVTLEWALLVIKFML